MVEHPELVAWRIKNFASVVGKENVIAGTDCGFSQYWDQIRVHPSVQWAKLQALAEGARARSKELWGDRMKRSTDRILTTHSGSLMRTREIIEGMKARTLGRPYDEAALAEDIRAGVLDVVRRQVEAGIDIPNDGEYARRGFMGYVNERLGGLEPRAPEPEEMVLVPAGSAIGLPSSRSCTTGTSASSTCIPRSRWTRSATPHPSSSGSV